MEPVSELSGSTVEQQAAGNPTEVSKSFLESCLARFVLVVTPINAAAWGG